MQQTNQHQQSPRPRSKQVQAVATPIGKKAAEYAGPSFNHSPAPANLPPPPFLSRSSSQQKEVQQPLNGGASLPVVDLSPLSFLFSAKQKEDSLRQISLDRPPALGYQYGSSHGLTTAATPAQQPRSGLFNMEGADAPLVSQIEMRAASNRAVVAREAQPKMPSSPWAPMEKPRAVNILEPQVGEPKTPTKPAEIEAKDGSSSSSSKPRSRNVDGKPDGSTDRSKAKRASVEGVARKKKQQQQQPSKSGAPSTTPKTPIKVVPRTILKRESRDGQADESCPQQHQSIPQSSAAPRQTATSTFKPLRKKAVTTTTTTTTDAYPPADFESEEDLRLQAANLMSILKLPTPSPGTASPASRHYGGGGGGGGGNASGGNGNSAQASTDPSAIESDIRRLLKLGA